MSNHLKINKISKTLSYILRHGAIKYNIDIDKYGYVKIDDILNLSQFKELELILDDIFEIVYNDSRGRYTIKESLDTFYIKANHGHSILMPNYGIKDISEPDKYKIVTYNTTYNEWLFIKQNRGLKKGNGNYIELHISGNCDNNYRQSRYNNPVTIYINLEKAMENGIKFKISSNNKILTHGLNGFLSIDFFVKVYNINNDSFFVF